MAMSANTADGDVMVEMNTTPLIDVMLVMLTLLIITLPIQTHAVKLDMPSPNSPPPAVIPWLTGRAPSARTATAAAGRTPPAPCDQTRIGIST